MDRSFVVIKEIGDCGIIYANGYLNGLGAERLEEECEQLLREGIKKIVVNFQKTELINSIGISVLIGIIEKVRSAGGHLGFCNLEKVHAETFEMLGFTKYVPIFPSEEEALISMEKRPPYRGRASRKEGSDG